MGAVKHFLGNYSENFAAALVLWPALSFLLTLPILAYLYHRDGRLRFGTFVGAYLTVLYVCGLGCFTLYPLPSGDAGLGITYGVAPNFNPMNFANDIAKDGLKAVFQLAFNVAFFMPLGFIAGRLLRLKFLPSVLLGMTASLLIETAQLTGLFGLYEHPYRLFDVDDLITNTLGAALGYLIVPGLDSVRYMAAVLVLCGVKLLLDLFVRRELKLSGELLVLCVCLFTGTGAMIPTIEGAKLILLGAETVFWRLNVKPGTPAQALAPWLEQLDLVLVMSVEPGFGGQKFMPSALDKLRWLKAEREARGLSYLLEVDGGVDAATAPLCVEAGADVLVAGSAVFGAADPAAAVGALASL